MNSSKLRDLVILVYKYDFYRAIVVNLSCEKARKIRVKIMVWSHTTAAKLIYQIGKACLRLNSTYTFFPRLCG